MPDQDRVTTDERETMPQWSGETHHEEVVRRGRRAKAHGLRVEWDAEGVFLVVPSELIPARVKEGWRIVGSWDDPRVFVLTDEVLAPESTNPAVLNQIERAREEASRYHYQSGRIGHPVDPRVVKVRREEIRPTRVFLITKDRESVLADVERAKQALEGERTAHASAKRKLEELEQKLERTRAEVEEAKKETALARTQRDTAQNDRRNLESVLGRDAARWKTRAAALERELGAGRVRELEASGVLVP